MQKKERLRSLFCISWLFLLEQSSKNKDNDLKKCWCCFDGRLGAGEL